MPEMPPQDAMFIIDMQKCKVKDFETSGWILDIGGGGEGIIGRLKGSMVIALDLKKEELEEAPAGPLKLIMDATKLQFLDNTFDTVTAFFSLMYFTKETRSQAFQEVVRVLNSGGRFHLWDVTIPPQTDTEKMWFVVPLTIQLPNEEVQTGYGVRWKGRGQTLEDYLQLAQQNGLKVISQNTTDHIFYMEFEK
ncbi:MAG: class I SAM-dependent methyltransferase [Candidatus Hermodarchaeia archaeon]|jgi:ubiquinone/menaquinone biosynthesis C-methylase UbiE